MALGDLIRNLFSSNEPAAPRPGSFTEAAEAFRERIALRPIPPPATGELYGVLVTPWAKTGAPFFALELAFELRAHGRKIRIFWDPTDVIGNAANEGEIAAVKKVIDALPADIEVIDVGALKPTDRGFDHELANSIVQDNAIWLSRGETGAAEFIKARPDSFSRVRAHLAEIIPLLQRERVDWLLLPGGIYGVSASYFAAARRLELPFTIWDSGPGLLLLSQSGIAAHHGDTAVAVEMLEKEGDERSIAFALAEGDREFERRLVGTDEHHFQLAPATGAVADGAELFVPLNLRWDAAALSRLRLFESVDHWLTSLLEWISHHPTARITVRQHPIERHALTRSVDDLSGIFARYAHLGDRVRFFAADEVVNSYDHMRAAKVVLPFTSSVGLEAAMLGVPVALATDAYYDKLPFVYKAPTVEDYFGFIERSLAGEESISPEGKRAATLAYYFTQRCAYVRTRFTPMPDEFREWVPIPAEELWSKPQHQDVRETLLTHTPLPIVQHRRFLNQA
jgi:hypothetical protein